MEDRFVSGLDHTLEPSGPLRRIEVAMDGIVVRIGRKPAGDRGGDPGAEGGIVIGPTGAVRVMMATRPVDFRKGVDGLAALVRETMGADPFSGAVYVFRAKRGDCAS